MLYLKLVNQLRGWFVCCSS